MTHDVFISYSRADAKIADTICEAFDNAGISYWIDRGGITSGDAFHEVIVRAIRESKITVFISSVNSNMSGYTIKEIVIAFKSKKHIIPFCIDEEPFADKIEFYLCDLDQLAYYLEKEFAIQRLVEDVARLLNKKTEVREQPVVSLSKAHKIITDNSQCVLKIRPNLDCSVFVDEELVMQASADKITKIPLNKGTFWLEFVNMKNEEDKYACEYTITNQEELLSVDLQSVAKKREELEIEKLVLLTTHDYKSGKYGFVDDKGKVVISLKYDHAWQFHEGLACVKLNGKWGFIDKRGEEIISCKYDNVAMFGFSEGLACVKLNGYWGWIDKNNEEIVTFIYDDAWSFSEGLAMVKLNGKYDFVDKKGKEITSIKYDNASSFSGGLAIVEINKKYGFIDKNGKEVIPCKYDKVWSCSEGLYRVKLNNKRGFIDKNGEAVPLRYDQAGPFSEGLAEVCFDDKWGYIDKSGKVTIPFKYDDAGSFKKGLARVELNGKNGFIDKIGRWVRDE